MIIIRPAERGDVSEIFAMINELADYERQPQDVTSTAADVRDHLFGENPKVFAHIAEIDGAIAGMALWFLTYSTWQGRHGILGKRPAATELGPRCSNLWLPLL